MIDIDEAYSYLDNIYFALDNSNTLDYKKLVLKSVVDRFKSDVMVKSAYRINANKYGLYVSAPMTNLSLEDTNKNLMVYVEIITNLIRTNRIDFPSMRAINTIYLNNLFNRNSVVYKNNKG